MTAILLPFPISANALWRGSGKRVYCSPEYTAWKKEADDYFTQQKRGVNRVKGNFIYHVTLDQNRRGKVDGDNTQKCLLDFAQRVELIENDRLADGGSWSWGEVDGCLLKIEPSPRGARPTQP